MRIELGMPGYVLLEKNLHDYNVWITAHGVIMIFFMVLPVGLRRVDSIQRIKEKGSNQKLRLFNLGKTISGDPS